MLLSQEILGPLAVDEIKRLPGFLGTTPACPEDRDQNVGANWTAAASFPDLAETSAGGGPGEDAAGVFWSSAVAKARATDTLAEAKRRSLEKERRPAVPLYAFILGLFVIAAAAGGVLFHNSVSDRTVSSRQPAFVQPPAGHDQPELRTAARMIPSCVPEGAARELRERISVIRSDARTEIRIPADGGVLAEDAIFEVDPNRQELRPRNEAARLFVDIRKGCGRP
ncbi:MAG: hypothetical protein PHF00_06915 [Elusimicrobia bacterium]|nr:hypothetical protein [Elusimicrobiota bacterium]